MVKLDTLNGTFCHSIIAFFVQMLLCQKVYTLCVSFNYCSAHVAIIFKPNNTNNPSTPLYTTIHSSCMNLTMKLHYYISLISCPLLVNYTNHSWKPNPANLHP